jgi:superfamily II DNA or RNA helicase
MASKHSSAGRLLATGIFDNLNSFSEIETRISALSNNKERGDTFEIFAEAYFATQKIAQALEVWPFEAVPLTQRQKLSLDTGRDMGVDGTYLTVDGELRAYQVKFRSNRTPLTWDELSTFMGLTDQVSQRVLFTNSEMLPSLMQDRSGFVPIRGSDLDRLNAEDFEAIRQWLQTGQVKLPRKHPLPHQQEALTAITLGLREQDRATIVMACGTGKSLVALWAAEQHKCKTILVLVPSLALVRQLLHEWLRETAWEQLTFMCVCSDPTVAKGADDLIVHQADLDFPVTTESAAVSQFFNKPFNGVKIIFSTYQSAQVVAAGLPVGLDGVKQPIDLAIFDEAHKTASRDGTRFSFALQDANLPIHKRLFFTATPRHYDIRKKDKEGDNALVYSMDRPEIYGSVIHTLSFAEAARRGIICDYKVVISVVTSEMVNDDLLKHGEVIVAGDTVKARQVALQIALQKAVEKYGVSRIFTFHGSVAAARSFTSSDSEGIQQHLPDFTTLHVSGEMSTSRREAQMKVFRQSEKAVISNARCLTEGVDVPAVDMVAFISPRKSKVDIVQATGRAMRKSPGKEFGYVLVPLFVEQVAGESIEEALRRTGFDDVWDLLGAMREQDDVLVDIIREMREEKGRTGGYNESRFSARVAVLGPSVSLETIRGSITAECVDSLGTSWDERFGELLGYKDKHDDLDIPINWPTGLGTWTSIQRRSNKNGELSSERRGRLDVAGFSWNKLDSLWESRFNELLAYKAEHGDFHVPQKSPTGLGAWLSQQKLYEKNGELTLERRTKLDVIGFSWDNRKPKTDWDDRFNELLSYKTENGNLDVPRNWPKGLGIWVGNQKTFLRDGKLSSERKDKLYSVGFELDTLESRWDSRFSELLEYKAKHGVVDVPHIWPTGLGQWVTNQKAFARAGKMSDDRRLKLDEIGISWESEKQRFAWRDRFTELVAYKAKHGRINVSQEFPVELGKWIRKQRSIKLSSEQQRLLNELGFVWDNPESEEGAE